MEGGGCDQRRRSLQDQMSAVDSANLRDFLRVKEEEDSRERLAGLSLDAVLSQKRRSDSNRTLLDIIRTEEPNAASYKNIVGKDKRSWKTFKDKIRLKRAGAAWTSTLHIPTSDIPVQNPRPQIARHQSLRFQTSPAVDSGDVTQEMTETEASGEIAAVRRPQMSRRCSARISSTTIPSESSEPEESSENAPASGAPVQALLRPQMSRHNSVRFPSINSTNSRDHDFDADFPSDINEEPRGGGGGTTTRRLSAALAEERQLSAREAAAAQEAAEAGSAAAAAAAEEANAVEQTEAATEAQPVRMSLMDLLEETDRQMGLVGSRYTMAEEEDDIEEEEEEEEDNGRGGGGGGGGGGTAEYNCCVCMVRHKGAAFIPCGHTFCRLCSRELWVSRGNCPLCNGFILEILDIF